MRYVLFVSSACPFCDKAQDLLQDKKQNYKVVNFEEDQEEVLKEIKEACGWPTVPIIFQIHDDKNISFIGGYTDLLDHLNG